MKPYKDTATCNTCSIQMCLGLQALLLVEYAWNMLFKRFPDSLVRFLAFEAMEENPH